MTSRERVYKALRFEEYDRVPLDGAIRDIENDVELPQCIYGPSVASGTSYRKGSYVDEWGSVWECLEDGVRGEVKTPLLKEWADLDHFQPPWDYLKHADLSMINGMCGKSDKFMVNMWCTEPFQRMQYLRGTENLFIDLAYGEAEVYKLRDMVHEYYMKKLELWANTDVDALQVEDDWGTQRSMLVSPQLWREFFKPLYKDYCDLAHSKGKFFIMHSDGYIDAILPDFIEIGVDAINAQIDCMDLNRLTELYHGKIAFWGGFDRQHLLPFGTPDEVRAEVRRIANTFFKYGRTGVIGSVSWDKGAKEENIYAYYDEWLKA